MAWIYPHILRLMLSKRGLFVDTLILPPDLGKYRNVHRKHHFRNPPTCLCWPVCISGLNSASEEGQTFAWIILST